MAAAEPGSKENPQLGADHNGDPSDPTEATPFGQSGTRYYDPLLVEEIDTLRKAMTDSFKREHSFTDGSVMDISRLLDLKINQYMKQAFINRQQVR